MVEGISGNTEPVNADAWQTLHIRIFSCVSYCVVLLVMVLLEELVLYLKYFLSNEGLMAYVHARVSCEICIYGLGCMLIHLLVTPLFIS